MNAKANRPLVTLAVSGYNHETLVAEAVLSAFAQTYSPLQIVLSDDCSTDRTFEIMQALAADYRGPHELVLNRNPKNIGAFGGHINQIFALARGDFVITAAADDVCESDRVEYMVRAWEATGRSAGCVLGAYTIIDQQGQPLVRPDTAYRPRSTTPIAIEIVPPSAFWRPEKPFFVGCSMGYRKDLLERFGPLSDDLVQEDEALSFRACLLGPVAFVNAPPLVKYRLHESNVFFSSDDRPTSRSVAERREHRSHRRLLASLGLHRQMRRDLQTARDAGWVSASEFEACLRGLDRAERADALMRNIYEQGLAGRLKAICGLLRMRAPRRTLRHALPRLLGPILYPRARAAINRLRAGFRDR